MRVFVTTPRVLSSGIEEKEVEECGSRMEGMVRDLTPGVPLFYHVEGRDWHRTRAGAIRKAEEIRAKKVASLKKQLAKLETLEF